MDPLTITTGVLGILKTSGELITGFYQLGTNINEARSDADAVAKELSNITVIIQGLQVYVLGRAKASPQRLQLITLEQIVATLTECVLTFSELDGTLKSLHIESGMKVWDRAMWLLKKDRVGMLVLRLQNHKSTFTMMLNILQSTSMSDAERTMERLCDSVDEVLRSNQELSSRLRNIEELNRPLARAPTVRSSIIMPSKDANSDASDGEVSSTNSNSLDQPVVSPHSASTEPATGGQVSSFEELLHRSRVYRHAADNESLFSINDARSTLALSICSSLTLGEVSNLSVYALPIYASELSNPYNYLGSGALTLAGADEQSTAAPEKRDRRVWLRFTRRRDTKPSESKQSKTKPSEPEKPVFGVPLSISIRYANVAISLFNDEGRSYIYGYVPIIVAKCGVFLKEKGMCSLTPDISFKTYIAQLGTDVENIFARSGHVARMRELQTVFESPDLRYGKGVDWTGYSVLDAANLLLRYFLQLPEPVVYLESYESFRAPLKDYQAQGAFDSDAAIKTYQKLITELPPLSRQLLLYVLDLLAVFASKSDHNKMTTPKLAALFQHGVLSHPQHLLDASETRLSQDVLIYLVENQDNFLIGMTGSDAFTSDQPIKPTQGTSDIAVYGEPK